MCREVTVVMLEPLNLFALIIAFWFQSDQYRESSNVDMLNGCGNQTVLNSTKRRWLPSKLHDEIVCSLASTQYNRLDTRSRVSPLGHFTSNDAITSRWVPSIPARSILALLPQSLQYNQLRKRSINVKIYNWYVYKKKKQKTLETENNLSLGRLEPKVYHTV